jgi:hypothetical protein
VKLVYRWLKLHLLYSRGAAPQGAISVADPTPWDGEWTQDDFRTVGAGFCAMGGQK